MVGACYVYVTEVSLGREWGRGNAGGPGRRGGRGGVEGAFPCPVRGSDQGGNKAVKVPSSVTFVTEEQFVCIMETLTYMALYVI